MAKLQIIGRPLKVEQHNNWIRIAIAEPDYKNAQGEFVTPWFSLVMKAENTTAKYLLANFKKIDVAEFNATETQVLKDGKTETYHNNIRCNVISWRRKSERQDGEAKSNNGYDNNSNSYDAYPEVEDTVVNLDSCDDLPF